MKTCRKARTFSQKPGLTAPPKKKDPEPNKANKVHRVGLFKNLFFATLISIVTAHT